MRTFLPLLLNAFGMVCLAQNQSTVQRDSLQVIWSDERIPDTARFDAGIELVRDIIYSAPPDSGLQLARELLYFAQEHHLDPQRAEAHILCGTFNNRLSRWDSAESHLLRAFDLYERLGQNRGKAKVMNSLGNALAYKGDHVKSIDYYTQGLRIAEAENDSNLIARLLGNIGVSHYEQGDLERGLEYFNRRIAVADRIGDRQCALEAYICIGITRQKQGRLIDARAEFIKSLGIAREINDVLSIQVVQGNLGTVYIDQGDYPKALAYLDSSLVLAERQEDPMQIANIYSEMARAHHLQGNESAALDAARKALSSAEIAGVLENWRDAAKINYTVLKAMGRKSEALDMHELYITMRDSMTNDDNKKRMMSQSFEYEFDKKEALLTAEQEKKDAVATEELRRKNLQRNAFIGGFGLMMLLAGTFFFQRNRISKARKRSDELLLNILPEEIAEELKEKGSAEAVQIDQVTVLFTDFKGFTAMSEVLTPKQLVKDLHECFSAFDHICEKHGLEKIKTIGDAYMAAGGLPTPNSTHATDVIKAAFEMRDFIAAGKAHKITAGLPYFEIRIGIHTGPVVAGIVGVKKFQYDIWGDTVNTASRMESSGEVGQVNISEATYALVKDEPGLSFTSRGKVQAKGKGELEMYFVQLA
ncbi:MAG: tetratricopeptide repeat protein [Flavobacteriales bacterium]|nr:tetratricopeptide repeat protein [Flavobacteriales bacterium]MBK6945422.1 tetratricopeptide repeat protein [Flavobacteriales bacterium]MBK9535020.1 tetratricopeptide repeat protein [Flavobacteriales bacterium]MBP9139330.1 tetratricopeptide repeat protein [Flavobacteriales bacterium]HQX30633.1 adenylate/guanylate cyclase domain-containing protein [Flavobacteriales bacterium]